MTLVIAMTPMRPREDYLNRDSQRLLSNMRDRSVIKKIIDKSIYYAPENSASKEEKPPY